MKIARDDTGFLASHPDGGWIPFERLGIDPPDTASVIADYDRIVAATERYELGDEVAPETLRCPVVRPTKVMAIGLNYLDHIRETGSDVPDRPVLFAKFPNSLHDPYGDIVMGSDITEQGDYEAELAVVIGKKVRRAAADDALSAVFAYAVANDVSARDWQFADPQFARSKSFDTFCPLGPWLTTADQVADPQALAIRSWVNDELRQDSSTKEMLFSVAELIAFLSRGMTLEPGDVLLTGTPHGVGFAMDPPQYLTAGDLVRCEVEGLGTITNRVVDGSGR